MPFSLIGGLIGQQGATAAGNQAFGNAQNRAAQNYSTMSPYLDTGAGGASMLSALNGTGFLNYYNGAFHGSNANAAGDQQTATNFFKSSPFYNPVTKVGEDFNTSPGYTFRLDQGSKALDRSAAARGMLLSGAQTKALTDYNQGQASQEYQNWLTNYMNAYNTALGGYVGSLGGQAARGAGAAAASINADTSAFNVGNQEQYAGNIAGTNALATGIMNAGNNALALALGGLGGLGGGGYGGGTAAGLSSYGSAAPTIPGDFGRSYFGVRGGI